MFIRSYEYLKPTIDKIDHYEIDGISRDGYATSEYINLTNKIILDRNTAVLYAGGAGIGQSESRDGSQVSDRVRGTVDLQKSTMLIKELSAYNLHKWIGEMENNHLVKYANINHNTCASSMHALYEAEQLLKRDDIDEVVVISEERTSFNTIRIFKEHAIPLVVGDGLVVMRLWKEEGIEISDCKWGYEWNRNPFGVTASGYATVDSPEVKTVKVHGTGTENNTAGESVLTEGRTVVKYKDKIGHTQGTSGLLELCMALEDETVVGDVLCVASGLGGFYGSCVLHKVR